MKIRSITIETNKLLINLDDRMFLTFRDDSVICCENKYMHTDDDLYYFIGAEYITHRIQNGPTMEYGINEIKESQFLIIDTSKGSFTVVNYNENNGYYRGFDLKLNVSELS